MTSERTPPWLAGIVDTLVGAALIRRSIIPHRNRLAVILIDSAFETACRAFLRHKAKVAITDSQRERKNLVKAVKGLLKRVDDEVWENIDYYYSEIRNDFYHHSAGKTITDVAVLDYQDTVEFVIDTAFEIRIGQIVSRELASVTKPEKAEPQVVPQFRVSLANVPRKVDKVILAVAVLSPKNAEEVNHFFKREGESLRLKPDELSSILARNSGSKKFFYYSKETKTWELSGLGRFKLGQLQGEVSNG